MHPTMSLNYSINHSARTKKFPPQILLCVLLVAQVLFISYAIFHLSSGVERDSALSNPPAPAFRIRNHARTNERATSIPEAIPIRETEEGARSREGNASPGPPLGVRKEQPAEMIVMDGAKMQRLMEYREKLVERVRDLEKIKYKGKLVDLLPVKLIRKVQLVREAKDRLPVHTLTFELPSYQSDLGVRMDHGDVIKVVVPRHKIKSYSMSDKGDNWFDITFKVYPGGKSSGYLDGIAIGDTMRCFAGGALRRNPGEKVGIVAFGVGITEGLPLAMAELEKSDARQVRLLWASKTYQDMFWLDKISSLQEVHGERFHFISILSREDRAGSLKGRINRDILKTVFDGPYATEKDSVRFTTVGTKNMMKDAYRMLRELDYDVPGIRDPGANRLLEWVGSRHRL